MIKTIAIMIAEALTWAYMCTILFVLYILFV